MIGTIELTGVRVKDKLYPWNSPYNISNTMLFVENSWARLNLDKVVGMKLEFKLLPPNNEVQGTIIDDSSKKVSKEEMFKILYL